MTAEPITENPPPVTCCDHGRQLDHIDTMLHEVIQKFAALDPLLPLVPRALALLDPGAAVRAHLWPGRSKAHG